MEIKVKIVMMSHLSDIQGGLLAPVLFNDRINFIKYLIITFPDTNVEIDADKVYQQYQDMMSARQTIDKGADVSNFEDPVKWQKDIREDRDLG